MQREAPVEAPASGTAVQQNAPQRRERVHDLGAAPLPARSRTAAHQLIHWLMSESTTSSSSSMRRAVISTSSTTIVSVDGSPSSASRSSSGRGTLRSTSMAMARSSSSNGDPERARSKPRPRARPRSRSGRTSRPWSSPLRHATAPMPSRSIPPSSISRRPASRMSASFELQGRGTAARRGPYVVVCDRNYLACGHLLPRLPRKNRDADDHVRPANAWRGPRRGGARWHPLRFRPVAYPITGSIFLVETCEP